MKVGIHVRDLEHLLQLVQACPEVAVEPPFAAGSCEECARCSVFECPCLARKREELVHQVVDKPALIQQAAVLPWMREIAQEAVEVTAALMEDLLSELDCFDDDHPQSEVLRESIVRCQARLQELHERTRLMCASQ